MKTSIPLIVGLIGLAGVPPLFFINWIMRRQNKDYDRSHLIEGTVVNLDFETRKDGKAYPIVEYVSGSKTVQFNNYACVPGAMVGDSVQIEIGADQKARVFTNIHAKMQTISATYMILATIIGVSALGWHFFRF